MTEDRIYILEKGLFQMEIEIYKRTSLFFMGWMNEKDGAFMRTFNLLFDFIRMLGTYSAETEELQEHQKTICTAHIIRSLQTTNPEQKCNLKSN